MSQIEKAKTGRSRCRKCRDRIEKDELRFGVAVESQFGESLQWYHLKCAAEKVPNDLAEALDGYAEAIDNRDELDQLIAANRKKQKPTSFPYAESAPSGRSTCIVCDEKIEKGEFRIAIEREIEVGGFPRTAAAYLHPSCAATCDEVTDDLADEIADNSTSLDDDAIEEVQSQLH